VEERTRDVGVRNYEIAEDATVGCILAHSGEQEQAIGSVRSAGVRVAERVTGLTITAKWETGRDHAGGLKLDQHLARDKLCIWLKAGGCGELQGLVCDEVLADFFGDGFQDTLAAPKKGAFGNGHFFAFRWGQRDGDDVSAVVVEAGVGKAAEVTFVAGGGCASVRQLS
jgi:hypothetical protein